MSLCRSRLTISSRISPSPRINLHKQNCIWINLLQWQSNPPLIGSGEWEVVDLMPDRVIPYVIIINVVPNAFWLVSPLKPHLKYEKQQHQFYWSCSSMVMKNDTLSTPPNKAYEPRFSRLQKEHNFNMNPKFIPMSLLKSFNSLFALISES